MPLDSQAVARITEDRTAAQARLQVITEELAKAEMAVVRWTNAKATVTDEIADLDQALALVIEEP